MPTICGLANKLEKQMEWMTKHPETEAVFGHVRQFVSEDLNENDRSRFPGRRIHRQGHEDNNVNPSCRL